MAEKCFECGRYIETGLGLLGRMDDHYTRQIQVPGAVPGFKSKEERFYCSLQCLQKEVESE